jgi:hypothetical protein
VSNRGIIKRLVRVIRLNNTQVHIPVGPKGAIYGNKEDEKNERREIQKGIDNPEGYKKDNAREREKTAEGTSG